MGCLKLQPYTTLQIAHTSNPARSREVKSDAGLYKYKYNGKEFQDELGLNVYAYGWRDYDPAIGRFNKMDRFAEKYYDMTPYQYGANNPVVFNDIRGDSIFIHSQEDNDRILYENGNLFSKDRKTGNWVSYSGKNVKVDKKGNKTIGGFLGKTAQALDKIRTGGAKGNKLISDLQKALYKIGINEGKNEGGKTRVTWDPSNTSGGPTTNGKTFRPAFIGLAHELGHAHDHLDNIFNGESIGIINNETIHGIEYYAMDWENQIRHEHSLPLRTHYGNDSNGKIIAPAYITIQTPSIEIKPNFSSTGVQFEVIINTINTVHFISN